VRCGERTWEAQSPGDAGPSPARGRPGFTPRAGFLGQDLIGDGLRRGAPRSRAAVARLPAHRLHAVTAPTPFRQQGLFRTTSAHQCFRPGGTLAARSPRDAIVGRDSQRSTDDTGTEHGGSRKPPPSVRQFRGTVVFDRSRVISNHAKATR
jgi:hypothetical protein